MEEEFKDITGYEGLYQINRKGEVKSLERYNEAGHLIKEKILKNRSSLGYKRVLLYKNKKNKNFKIHVLLFKTFVCEYDNMYLEIDHINNIRSDNRLENLRLVSKRNNMNNRSDQSEFGVGVRKFCNNYQTRININKKNTYIGRFNTHDEASNKYKLVKHQIEEIEKITLNYDFKRTKVGKEYFIEFFSINACVIKK